jgi:F-type H+-transporting ATPase subunit delta
MLSNQEITNKYAAALFDLSSDNKSRVGIESELHLAYSALSQDYGIKNIIFNRFAPYYMKLAILENLLVIMKPVNIVENFLKLLLKNNRMHCLQYINSQFHKLMLESDGVKMIDLSVVSKDNKFVDFIKRDMEKKLGSKVIVNTVEDDSIIAGFIIKISNIMADYSLRAKLNKLSKIME